VYSQATSSHVLYTAKFINESKDVSSNEKKMFAFIKTCLFLSVCPEGGGDKYAGCGYWKRLGYCLEKNGYRDQMEKNCPATCNFCKDLG